MDASPQAYKDIEAVIAAQDELVEVIGKFTPLHAAHRAHGRGGRRVLRLPNGI